jgi:hypothetical protein
VTGIGKHAEESCSICLQQDGQSWSVFQDIEDEMDLNILHCKVFGNQTPAELSGQLHPKSAHNKRERFISEPTSNSLPYFLLITVPHMWWALLHKKIVDLQQKNANERKVKNSGSENIKQFS